MFIIGPPLTVSVPQGWFFVLKSSNWGFQLKSCGCCRHWPQHSSLRQTGGVNKYSGLPLSIPSFGNNIYINRVLGHNLESHTRRGRESEESSLGGDCWELLGCFSTDGVWMHNWGSKAVEIWFALMNWWSEEGLKGSTAMKFETRSSASRNQLHLSYIEKVSLDNFDEGYSIVWRFRAYRIVVSFLAPFRRLSFYRNEGSIVWKSLHHGFRSSSCIEIENPHKE